MERALASEHKSMSEFTPLQIYKYALAKSKSLRLKLSLFA